MANINITGPSQNVIENHGTANLSQTVQSPEPKQTTATELFGEVLKALPGEDRDEVAQAIVNPLMQLAEQPADVQATPDSMERINSFLGRLTPYLPTISKATIAFSEAALQALASSNPVVAGLLAACRSIKS